MQRFDTYHVIQRYAQHPESLQAFLAFQCALRTTDSILQHEALLKSDPEHAVQLKLLSVGATQDLKQSSAPKATLSAQDIVDMDKDHRDKLYIDLCRQAGVQIDPETLMNQTHQSNRD